MIRKNIHKITLTVVALLFFAVNSRAQYASEDEMKTAANEMFEEANYIGSIKLFSQLLSTYPKDPSYNYKYGACVLFGSRDKEKALKYLKFAVSKSNVDPEAFYFLAKAYHHNYQFAPAIVYYNKYKGKTTAKDHQKYNIDREIKMCENGSQLIKSMTNIGVLSKKEIKATDFFRSYELNGIGGKIIVKPDDFKSKLDIKKNENSVIYLGEKKDMVVYSSYGKTDDNGKDIYRVVRLPSGEWSKPTSIGDEINTEFDEDYPFLHPDGRTLYFSSKGYNSMGGYDIFKSTLDPSTGKWTYPENLDFPINTPDDDILFISDIDNKLAYFGSSRASKQGELTVYRVKVDPEPVGSSVIKGFFVSESNPTMKSATITIKDAEQDRRYGVYKTNNESGEYLLAFPSNGGKFKILVETTSDAPVHAAIIELPELDGFRALKQELRLVGEGDAEKLVVKNLFDETDEFDINDPLVVQNILKERAKLEVNTTEEEVNNSLANSLKAALENQSKPKSSYSDLSDDQLVNKTDEVAANIIDQTATSKEQANKSYEIANTKSAEAKELYNEAKTLSANGDVEKAEAKKLEAAKLINEVVAALAIAKTLDNEAVERESDLEKVKSLQENINTSIDNGNREEAEAKMTELDEIASATYHTESALEKEEELSDDNLAEKEKVYTENNEYLTELTDREYELKETIKKLEEKKETTKKKSEIADIDTRIEALKIDVEDTKFDIDNAKNKTTKIDLSYNKAKSEAAITKDVIASVGEGEVVGTPISEASKLQLENDVVYFENEGMVGIYPTESEISSEEPIVAVESYNLEEHKDEYAIIDDSGEIIDYNTTYSSKIVDADSSTDPVERAEIVMQINESWIKDIGDEIAIREKQLNAETSTSEKTKLEDRIEVLKALKLEKQKEFIENEKLIADNKPILTEETTSPVVSTSSEEDVNIMNTDGTLIDYETKYNSELDALGDEETYATSAKKAEIHGNWANATEQEILIKKMALVEADEADKNEIENEIAVLENTLVEQQEFAGLYEMQAESMKPEGVVEEEPIASTEEAVTTTEEPIVENEEPVARVGSNYEEELEAIGEEDTYESNVKKAAIHNDWAKATEKEIATKKEALSVADEADKNGIENEIAVLENTLVEQQEFAGLYEMQAESMKPEGVVEEELIASTEEAVTTTEEAVVENEEPVARVESNYTEELEAIGDEDTYESNLKKAEIHGNWAKATEKEIATQKEALSVADEADKNGIENEIAVLENTLVEQQEFAGLYEMQAESMKPEGVVEEEPIASTEEVVTTTEEPIVESEEPIANSESILNTELKEEDLTVNNLNDPSDDFSNLKYNNKFNYQSTQSKNSVATIADLKNEARELKEESEVKINTAGNASSEEEKEQLTAEANELLDQSNGKQERIAKVYEGANRSEFYNNQATLSELKSENPNKGSNETIMAELLVEESDNYYDQAKRKREQAADMPNFTSKTVTLQQAYELEMKAIEKQKMAMNKLSGGSTSEPIVSTTTTEPVSDNENPVATSDEISTEDQTVLLNLSPVEISAIQDSEDFQEYAALKKTKRRLVKEAKVEYVEAAKFEEEAKDQEQLGLSLKAMAEGAATEEDKAKKLSQIEKLNKMIADNKSKSAELKSSAADKETQAKEAGDKSDFILINTDEDVANNYTAIEKAETFDGEFMAKVMARTSTPSPAVDEPLASIEEPIVEEVATEEPIAEEPVIANEEVVVEENPVATSEEPIVEEVATEEPIAEEPVITNEEVVVEENPVATNEDPIVEEPVVTNEEPKTEEPIVEETATNDQTLENIDVIPEVLSKSIFVINNNKAAYNSSKRIPTTTKLPEGLVFKVQVGAFRNAIPQDHFKGFAPILAEDAGNGITRYTAGLFKTFNTANEAKGSIRSIGYSDAFVVAFYNGKRININEARAMIDSGTETNDSFENTPIVSTETVENTETPTVTEEPVATETNDTPIVTTEEVKDGVSTDVRNITGAFYTIQVGVYSKEVTAGQLNNVSPINSERTSGGLIRYTSGVYKTLEDANTAKERIRGLGITDAFVIAYNGGVKIKVAEATALLNNDNPTSESVEEEVEVPVEAPVEEIPIESEVVQNDLNLEFKVMLGEYVEDVPVDEAGIFLKLSEKGITNYEENDKTIYIVGSFTDYQSALDLQIEVKEMGVKNPKTIAFKDGEDITIEEALELIKNNK